MWPPYGCYCNARKCGWADVALLEMQKKEVNSAWKLLLKISPYYGTNDEADILVDGRFGLVC